MPKISIIDSEKTVAETLVDLRKLFSDWSITDWEPIPGQDGRSYSVRYFRGQWIEIKSELQPTKAHNLRVCYQVIQYMKLWENRGITGIAKGVTFVGGGLVPTREDANRENYEESCATLGVPSDASWEEIDRTYKLKVQFAHPDKGGDPERFKRVQAAFEYLKKVKGPKIQPEAQP